MKNASFQRCWPADWPLPLCPPPPRRRLPWMKCRTSFRATACTSPARNSPFPRGGQYTMAFHKASTRGLSPSSAKKTCHRMEKFCGRFSLPGKGERGLNVAACRGFSTRCNERGLETLSGSKPRSFLWAHFATGPLAGASVFHFYSGRKRMEASFLIASLHSASAHLVIPAITGQAQWAGKCWAA